MKNNDEIEIDLLKLVKTLWKKAWAIVLAAVIFGGAMFAYGKYTDVPTYTTKATLYTQYTNTRDFAHGESGGNISQNSMSEARSLVNTCISVLNTRMTREAIIEAANLDMTDSQLAGMISAASVSGTELFTVTVTGTDAEETALIANTVAEVLSEKVAMVNSSSFVGVIDAALVPTAPNPNSITKDAAVAAVLGAFLVCAVVVVKELMADWKAYSTANKKNTEEES